MIDKLFLKNLYTEKGLSATQIAKKFSCSAGKINYWLSQYRIQKRSISEAVYTRRNPAGDPFNIKMPKNVKEAILYGVGIGLYWGEGTKRNMYSVRLGNSDPLLIKKFCDFLEIFYGIPRKKLHFGLQIFGDMNQGNALVFWKKALEISREQFYKVVVTPHRGVGTYRRKTKYGVITVYFNNKKLRDIICTAIDIQSRQ